MAAESSSHSGLRVPRDSIHSSRAQPATDTDAELRLAYPAPSEEPRVDSDHLQRRLLALADPAPASGSAQAEPQRVALETLLRELLRAAALPSYLRWIKASAGQGLRLIPVDTVLYFQADTKYTRVVTFDAEALIRTPLKDLRQELDPASFWPIHRSTIVNAHAIKGVTRDSRGRSVVQLKQRDDKLAVSEAHEYLFRQM